MQQVFDLWINPELERRQAAGCLPADFVLRGAQVIFNVGAAPQVRLNDEVRAIGKLRPSRVVAKGEPVMEDDLEHIESIELTDQDPNAGHITLLRIRDNWWCFFDFRYNAARIAEILKAARDFLDAAAFALARGALRVVVDNLFSATELMAKGQLLPHAGEELLGQVKDDDPFLVGKIYHPPIRTHFQRWGELGNTNSRYVQLLDRLTDLRNPARYLIDHLDLDADDAREMLVVAEEMYQRLYAEAPTRYQPGE